jgi:acylphosphatase
MEALPVAIVAKRVYFFGRVQGVGFRRRTERAARDLAVSGFVRNLTDGSVELAVEGEADAVQALLGRIRAQFGLGIDREVEAAHQATGGAGFTILDDRAP